MNESLLKIQIDGLIQRLVGRPARAGYPRKLVCPWRGDIVSNPPCEAGPREQAKADEWKEP